MSKNFRYYRFLSIVLFFIFLSSRVFAEIKEIPPLEPFTKEDRVLVLAPHPDDEDISCGGVIQRALKSGAQVKVAYLTCGDNNIFSIVFYNKFMFLFRLFSLKHSDFTDLGNQRVQEAINAMKILGLDENNLIFLGYPDHGTDHMFVFHWNQQKPYRSSFSGHSHVPYDRSAGYKKKFTADNVIEDVKSILADYKPTKVFVASSSDVNGDHWAYYLYLMASLYDLGDSVPRPKIYPYLIHAPGWPLPRHYHPGMTITPPEKFFGDALPIINWHQLKLTNEEIDKKHKAMLAYDTQDRISGFYLMSFVRENELFGDFPYLKLKKQYSAELAKQGKKPVFTTDLQWEEFAVVDNFLWVKFKKPKALKQRLSYFFAIFEHKNGVPFSKIPNILVHTRYNKFTEFNSITDKYITGDGSTLEFNPETVIFKIPLSTLGNPDGFLFGFETNNDYLPEGCMAFRVITIE